MSCSQWKRKRKPLALGYVAPNSKMAGGDGIQAVTQDNLVYFNSNDFHGHQFLTNDAIDAGYTSRPVQRDPSLLEKGVASLIEKDIGSMAVTAENSLLRVLVLHGAARTTAKNMIDARRAVSSGIDRVAVRFLGGKPGHDSTRLSWAGGPAFFPCCIAGCTDRCV
jgi:hypothetical protein